MATILFITDFSSGSENAVKYAHDLAQLMRARLILIHSLPVAAQPVAVLSNGSEDDFSFMDVSYEEDVNQKLAELKEKLENSNAETAVVLQTLQRKGQLTDQVPVLIKQEKVDLVIIGQEETGSVKGSFPHSGITKVITTATCPVLIVPQQAVFKPFWKIVYATDLKREPASDCALLLKLAHLFNAEIMLLHILKQDGVGAREFAIEELQKVYRKLPYRNVSFYIEANEVIEAGISTFVQDNKADLLVLSSHPKQVWQHLLPGSNGPCEFYQSYLPLLIRHHPANK